VRLLHREAQRDAGKALAERVAPFRPSAVIFIRDGGELLGRSLARHLSVPAFGLDLSYPLRRRLDRLPLPLRAALWPVKELVYRVTRPRLAPGALDDGTPRADRAILVDDTASSGRTISAAVEALAARGIPRSALRVVVLRCGPRAKPLVDEYLTDGRAWALR
jgi:hypoxanthine phosphoribosyltransferase